jgi:hypothetical protein
VHVSHSRRSELYSLYVLGSAITPFSHAALTLLKVLTWRAL